MPGRRSPHHTASVHRCVTAVTAVMAQKSGYDESAAYAICSASVEGAGHPLFDDREASSVDRAAKTIREVATRGLGGPGSGPHPRTISVSKITSNQLLSSVKVDSMATKLKQGTTKLPPIDVEKRGAGYHVVDGNHRYSAHVQAGMKKISAIVHPAGYGKKWRQKAFRG
jgi:hypothetical protein